MEQVLKDLVMQFPIIGVVGVAVWFVTGYIDKTRLENTARYDLAQKENRDRYDALDKEFKTELRTWNEKLADLTDRSIAALKENTRGSDLIQQKMDKITENQITIIHQTDKIK
jgi:hypothetical protein